jgi:SpoVK/Ycf46/Vps4 family AAA+-type ATPase
VAEFLGWPLLSIDPSHLLRNGMDGIQAEANAIFRRLQETEGIVVLFDEFDELVRERTKGEDSYLLSPQTISGILIWRFAGAAGSITWRKLCPQPTVQR